MTEKSMPRTTHVVRRGATYYFRMRVPQDLVTHYRKNEITFSLNTKELAEAKRKGHSEALRHIGEFEQTRARLNVGVVDSMTREQIEQLADGFVHDLLSEDEDARIKGVPATHRRALEVLEDHSRPVLAGEHDHDGGESLRWMTRMTRHHIDRLGLKIARDSHLEAQLVYALAGASVRAVEVTGERDRGRVMPTPQGAFTGPLEPPKNTPKQTASILLSTAIDTYAQEQERAKNWQGKTGPENRAIYRILVEAIGDVPMSVLDHSYMVAFKGVVQRLPANINKNPKYRGKSISEIREMSDVEPMSITTVNKYLTRASSFLKWAMQHGYVTRNFAEGLSIRQRGKKASDARDMFEETHLKAIFRAIGERRVTASGKASSFHYWAPLLGYFTGARVNEIASLRLSDFDITGEISSISISQQNDGEKTTKTQAGIRKIPVHPELVRLGLLSHLETLHEQGQSRLFPELKQTKNGYGSKITSWFSGHSTKGDSFLWRDAGIQEKRLSFHSYRHTVATLLERSGADKILTKRILGHSLEDDVTYGRYSKGAELKHMQKALIEALSLEPLGNLPVFKQWQAEFP